MKKSDALRLFKQFCDDNGINFIARDKDGQLSGFQKCPMRAEKLWTVVSGWVVDLSSVAELLSNCRPIKWEDEPIKIESLYIQHE